MPTPALEQARGVADAVLYEGYLLYPYRRSSGKNRMRFQFGVLAPRRWIEAQGAVIDGVAGSTESWWQQTEVLVEPARRTADALPEPALTVRLRFLQLQDKQIEIVRNDGSFTAVDELDLDGDRHLSFPEGVPHEIDLAVPLLEATADEPSDAAPGERSFPIEIAGGTCTEPVLDADGTRVGQIRRTRRPLVATVRVSIRRCDTPFPLLALTVRTENVADALEPTASREAALRHALIATHTVLAGDGMRFVSLLDPPAWAAEAARCCRNVRTFPVLVGPAETHDVVLSSPIILYDHPQIAPESPGDLHDAAEIDEILSLRTLTLSDEEKREVRATDPRGAAIVDRVDAMPPEVLDRLHGAIRHLRPAGSADDDEIPDDKIPWWQPGGDADVSPDTDTVLVDGLVLGPGSRVRLRPRVRGSDAHDMFLAGRTAVVEKVLLDVDGTRFLAVAVDDDPGADLHEWYGRFRHFRPDEVEPLGDPAVEPLNDTEVEPLGDSAVEPLSEEAVR